MQRFKGKENTKMMPNCVKKNLHPFFCGAQQSCAPWAQSSCRVGVLSTTPWGLWQRTPQPPAQSTSHGRMQRRRQSKSGKCVLLFGVTCQQQRVCCCSTTTATAHAHSTAATVLALRGGGVIAETDLGVLLPVQTRRICIFIRSARKVCLETLNDVFDAEAATTLRDVLAALQPDLSHSDCRVCTAHHRGTASC